MADLNQLRMKPNMCCTICSKEIYRRPSRRKDTNFCSVGCRNKYYSGDRNFSHLKTGRPLGVRDKIRDRKKEKERRLRYKENAVALLGGYCQLCGYNKYIGALEFHHKDPLQKDAAVKELLMGSWKWIEEEIKKCILVCANCHREIHFKQRQGEYYE